MTPHAATCTFCDLIHGAAEVSICHEDADSIAFMDIQPVNNGHVLVVPRTHYDSLRDVPPEIGKHLFDVTMRLADAVTTVSDCHDLNIVVNSGPAAGQDEPHFHIHIIPRRDGDGFDIPLPFDGSAMPDRTILDAYAARIIAALRDPTKDEARAINMHTHDHTERVVAMPRFAEAEPPHGERRTSRPDASAERSEPRRRGAYRVIEGPHGELRYEPFSRSTDAS